MAQFGSAFGLGPKSREFKSLQPDVMIVSASREFIFIHLEKCGGTSVETALEPHLEWSDIVLGSTDFGEAYQQLLHNRFGVKEVRQNMLWKHSTAQDIRAFVGPEIWNDFTKISVVREPVDLVKSLYFFSQAAVQYHIGRINRQIWKEMLRTRSFPEQWPYTEHFVHAYAQSEIDGSGIDGFVKDIFSGDYEFIRPQYERIQVNGSKDLDIVIDLCYLNNEWQNILDACKIEDAVSLNHLNASERDPIELSPKSLKIIKKHFAIDYQQLPKYTGVTW